MPETTAVVTFPYDAETLTIHLACPICEAKPFKEAVSVRGRDGFVAECGNCQTQIEFRRDDKERLDDLSSELIASIAKGHGNVGKSTVQAMAQEILASRVGVTSYMENLVKRADKAPSGKAILSTCLEIAELLVDKNRKYGNSALEPARVFSKASPVEQILVRLDDKVSRLRSGQTDDTEDVEMDLMGYLVLLRIARKNENYKKG